MMMDTYIFEAFYFALFSIILGLIVGSFISFLSYRFPIFLEKIWRNYCFEFLKLEKEHIGKINLPYQKQESIPLLGKRSVCPTCYNVILFYHNIPIISYLVLKGKCAYCHHSISWRYPLIEITTALLFFILSFYYEPNIEWVLAITFTSTLLLLSIIDLEHQYLPDEITLPLIWLGLIVNLFGYYTELPDAVIGTISGYLFLWIITTIFKLITKKDGMGHGDFKLLAASGAWLGWQHLPFIIIFASILGLCINITLLFLKKIKFQTPTAFGQYIALATYISMLYGDNVIAGYLNNLYT